MELRPNTPYVVSKTVSTDETKGKTNSKLRGLAFEPEQLNDLSDTSIVIKFTKEIFTFLKHKYLIFFTNIRQWPLSKVT